MFTLCVFAQDTTVKTIKKESALRHSAIVFVSSLPLALTYSLLSYRFYKMYEHSSVNYSLSKKETKNVIYVGISLSFVYSLVDYFNYKKKVKNGNRNSRNRKKN